jgi:hypothetical protein
MMGDATEFVVNKCRELPLHLHSGIGIMKNRKPQV